jgi:hypothetical protein
MIAHCKLCQELIEPASPLAFAKKVNLAKLEPHQQSMLLLSAGITAHVQQAHPEYMAMLNQLASTFIGNAVVMTVTVGGEQTDRFSIMTAADADRLRIYWDALPNPPNPELLAQLDANVQRALKLADQLTAQKQGGVTPN